jgi:hypothetical protein
MLFGHFQLTRMRALPFLLQTLLIVVLLGGCVKQRKVDSVSGSTNNNGRLLVVNATNRSYLQQFLIPGAPTNLIVAQFGSPKWSDAWHDGVHPRLTWNYDVSPFLKDIDRPDLYVVGFSIDITNGRLAYWDWITMTLEPPLKTLHSVINVGSNSEHSSTGSGWTVLKLFLLSKTALDEGRFINTEAFPNLGYVSLKPAMTVDRLKDVQFGESTMRSAEHQNQKAWIFDICFLENDARQFDELTDANLGKTILMMLDDRPIYAGYISGPIPTGITEIEITNEALMKLAKAGFERMRSENRK